MTISGHIFDGVCFAFNWLVDIFDHAFLHFFCCSLSPPIATTTAAAIAISSLPAPGSADEGHDNDNEGQDKEHEDEEEVVID
jgi:hypothetical protein